MKFIDWKLLNTAFWVEIMMSYVLPFQVVNSMEYQIGYPMPFLSFYNTTVGISPLTSMSFNPLGFLFNGVILYLIILAVMRVYRKFKSNFNK